MTMASMSLEVMHPARVSTFTSVQQQPPQVPQTSQTHRGPEQPSHGSQLAVRPSCPHTLPHRPPCSVLVLFLLPAPAPARDLSPGMCLSPWPRAR